MNVKEAASQLIEMIKESNLPNNHPEYGKDHLLYMVEFINNLDVTIPKYNEKGMRWLGYIQGCLTVSGSTTLEEMKNINRRA